MTEAIYLWFPRTKPTPKSLHSLEGALLKVDYHPTPAEAKHIKPFYTFTELADRLTKLNQPIYRLTYLCVLMPIHVLSNVCPAAEPYYYRPKPDFFLTCEHKQVIYTELFSLPRGDIAEINFTFMHDRIPETISNLGRHLDEFSHISENLYDTTMARLNKAIQGT